MTYDDALPHSRACGMRRHPHGSECHSNCPTCHGVGSPEPPAGTPIDLTGISLIARERVRQLNEEGWTPDHDDEHTDGALRFAAANYAQRANSGSHPIVNPVPDTWPWAPEWWKPSDDPIRNLVKAGALIAAEIDRLLRAAAAEAAS